jgi:signal transduction histidine kinase
MCTSSAPPSPPTERELRERLKELDCLYTVARLFARPGASLDDILQGTVVALCAAWQYPEVACARIRLERREVTSPGWAEPVAAQESPIIAHGEPVGRILVGYTRERPPEDEGPFLNEERNLLNVVAQLLAESLERKGAEAQLVAREEQLRRLTAELSLSEERERRRLAQALHDRIGQVLALVSIRLGALLERTPDPERVQEIREVRRLVAEATADTRSLTFDLSPPVLYELGLEAALEWLADRLGAEHGLLIACQLETGRAPVPDALRVVLFQCARELLTNVGKHARAQRVTVTLRRPRGRVQLGVEDDGVGFDLARLDPHTRGDDGFGLFNIQERLTHLGGRVDVQSVRGQGTRILLDLPVRPRRRAQRSLP